MGTLSAKRIAPRSLAGAKSTALTCVSASQDPPFRLMRAIPLESRFSSPARIIRALARDAHVVHVAFAQARVGDAHELGLLVQLGERLGADVAHGGAQ